MNITLTKQEIRKILEDKFGKGTFRLFYTESDKLWEARMGRVIANMSEVPNKESFVVYFDE